MKFYATLFLALVTCSIFAQQTADINNTVQLTADYSKQDQTITLRWENFADVTNFFIYQKDKNATNWCAAIATLPGTDTSYVINNVEIGSLKEYKVQRFAAVGGADGYAHCGIEVRPVYHGRKIILLVEQGIDDALPAEVDQYIEDITAEGWLVHKIVVDKSLPVADVKALITDAYDSDPMAYHAIFILGHVAVPYSGNLNPDGHNNHVGAWPCDGYYGEMDGNWTDQGVNNTTASQSRNHNVPGDGKFDQTFLPSNLELAVGRVDMSNLDKFSDDEVTLTRKYLEKNHAFRKAQIKSPHRGVIENNFGLAEGFGQNGFRNFTSLLGRDNTYFGDYDDLKTESYLWSYGAGGGNFQGASGISNTTNFAQDSIQTIFTMLFGSYFGDWDSANNFLRAALATGTTLTNVWAGRPHWHFHAMGMGASISESVLTSQNNSGTYVGGFGARYVHTALMGDPTLKMEYVMSPSELEIQQVEGNVMLNWKASNDPDFDGYRIYRSFDGGEVQELNDNLMMDTAFTDSCVGNHTYQYYVSAVRLVEGFTGSYYNDSPASMGSILIDNILLPEAAFNVDVNNLIVTLTNTSLNADNIFWDFGDGTTGNSQTEMHEYSTPGEYTITLTVADANGCWQSITSTVVNVDVSGLDELDDSQLYLFPNPGHSSITIESKIPINDVAFYDQLGKYITSFRPEEKRTIHVSQLTSGFYHVVVNTKDQRKTRRTFIKL